MNAPTATSTPSTSPCPAVHGLNCPTIGRADDDRRDHAGDRALDGLVRRDLRRDRRVPELRADEEAEHVVGDHAQRDAEEQADAVVRREEQPGEPAEPADVREHRAPCSRRRAAAGPGVISHRNHSIDTITTMPEEHGIRGGAVVTRRERHQRARRRARRASPGAGRACCSELANSSVATPTMTAASTDRRACAAREADDRDDRDREAGHDRGRQVAGRLRRPAPRGRPRAGSARRGRGRGGGAVAVRVASAARAARRARRGRGERGVLVDRALVRQRAELRVLAREVVGEVGLGPVGALGAEARLRAGDGRPRVELVGGLGVVGEDRGHRAGGRLGPVRQRRDLAGRRFVERRRPARTAASSSTPSASAGAATGSAPGASIGRRPSDRRPGRMSSGSSADQVASDRGSRPPAGSSPGRPRRVGSRRSSGVASGRAAARPLRVVGRRRRGSRGLAEARSGLLGAEDADTLDRAGVRRRTGRSRVPHPRVLTVAG